MPTVVENRAKWSGHTWDLDGHEWSPGGTRAGTELLWWRSIVPRIQSMLPTGTLLEIAPGFGRWTAYLVDRCERLIAVDITDRCVDICRERFAATPHAEFWTNDGETLPMVAPASIDFAFSFDSLVHVEADQIGAYLRELARKLKPGAAGFFHHSNLGAYSEGSGKVPSYITKRHWRAASMSARVFRDACREAGLVCVGQEVINWIGKGARADRHRLPGERIPLTDCFSTFVKPPDTRAGQPTRVYINPHFVDEWRQLLVLASLYGTRSSSAVSAETQAGARPEGTPAHRTRLEMVRTLGLAGTMAAVRARLSRTVEAWRSRTSEKAVARVYASREPIVRSLVRGRCPDCQRTISGRGGAAYCRACDAAFVTG